MAIKNVNPEWLDQKTGGNPVTRIDWIEHKTLDIPYGDDPLQKLDLYLPDGETDLRPVIFNVHGGGFSVCDKRDFHLYPTLFALERGFAVAAVNYRLSPAVRYPTHIADILDALEWLGREGAAHRLDRNNVFLWGTSAGGNIVLQAGCRRGVLPRHDGCRIGGIASLCAAYSLQINPKDHNTLLGKLLAPKLMKTMRRDVLDSRKPLEEALAEADVSRYLADGIAPVYLQHGTKDPAIPYAEAERMATRLEKLLKPGDFVFDTLENAGHAGGGPDYFQKENVTPILDFFTAHLQKG